MKKHFDIVSGPNKDRLLDAFKYAYDKNVKLDVDFKVALGYTAPKSDPGCACLPMSITDIIISGIEHEDSSGESFNLCGYCRVDLYSPRGVTVAYESYRFRAYYNAKTRKGRIAFFPN